MADMKMEAEIIFDSHVPNALRRALEYAVAKQTFNRYFATAKS